MEWKLKNVIQETNHKFLNFYTVHYDVTMDDGTYKDAEYYLASRKPANELRCVTHEYEKPDACMIALYYVDEKTKEVSMMITTQFRQALGTYMTSMPAGLVDPEDKDIYETARREALEEAGVLLDDIEILAPASTTSSGMSDEMNAMVLARISGFANNALEEFEDITANLIPLRKIKDMLSDPKYIIPIHTRLTMLYLIERFGIK
ncbi:MAG: NUDIX hydrolase [Bacilli bacterium]|nr:NUDIX hydrolase [Bacilli bacterium]